MAKDYFQGAASRSSRADDDTFEDEAPQGEKSIRNIQVSSKQRRVPPRAPVMSARKPSPKNRPNYLLWVLAGGGVLVLGLIAMVALRPTTVTIIPRSHTVVFDQTIRLTAYPAQTAASGTLTYTVQTNMLEDSELVPTTGTEHVDEKASGTLTVYNKYSAQTVKLVKNTRFEGPGGLIFRTPSDVVVPGKKGTSPGKVSVTVIADVAGQEYNVPAADRWNVPGLKSNPSMYAGVYAVSDTPMSGGFSGDRAGFAPGVLEAAQGQIRSRLAEKVSSIMGSSTSIALPGLVRVSYESVPPASEGANARVVERARVEMPVFPKDMLATIIGESVSADASSGALDITFPKEFSASFVDEAADFGDTPFQFSMNGTGTLVWRVDTEALAQALSGREKAAFQTIVRGFPAIQEAHARVQPFWESTFPEGSKIRFDITRPKESNS